MERTKDQQSSQFGLGSRRGYGPCKRKSSHHGSPQKLVKITQEVTAEPKTTTNQDGSSGKHESPLQPHFSGFRTDSVLRQLCEKHLQDLRHIHEPYAGSLNGNDSHRDPEQKIRLIMEELRAAFSLNGIQPEDPVRKNSMCKADKLASDIRSSWRSIKSGGVTLKIPDLVNPGVPLNLETCWQDGFAVVFADDVPPTPLCLLCGSAGTEQMIYCSTCCEPYHLFCLDEDPRMWNTLRSSKLDDGSVVDSLWSCKRCWLCSLCGLKDLVQPKDSPAAEIFCCDRCRRTFHNMCSGKTYSAVISLYTDQEVPFRRWLCDFCVKCKSCNVRLAATLDKKCIRKHPEENSAVCKNCFKQIKKGSYCPVCNSAYDDNDYETRMLECGKCERWIHAACEGITEEQYQMISFLPNCADFACSLCESGNKIPSWKSVLSAYISKGCEEIIERFAMKVSLRLEQASTNDRSTSQPSLSTKTEKSAVSVFLPEKEKCSSKSLLCADRNDGMQRKDQSLLFNLKQNEKQEDLENSRPSIENDTVLPWSPSKQKVLTAIENSNFGQNVNIKPVFLEPKCQNLDSRQTSVRNVTAFMENVKSYHKLNQSVTANCFSVAAFVSIINSSVESYCQDGIEELCFRDAIMQDFKDSLLSVFTWWKESLLMEMLLDDTGKCVDVKPSAKHEQLKTHLWDPAVRLDSRQCKLCGSKGDMSPDGPGRLLWTGFGGWVHVNCALWSCEVWEDEQGGLHQVHSAIFRGKSEKCKLCENYGATVSCCRSSCKNSYHFLCAMRSGCLLRNDMSVYCKVHRTAGEIEADFHVSRRMYVVDNNIKKKETSISSKKVQLIIGSLRVRCLGTLNSSSVLFSRKEQKSYLVSDGLTCQRIYWSKENPLNLDSYELQTYINKSFENRIATVTPKQHIVIDHSETNKSEKAKLESKLRTFQHWTDTAPVYIDEFGSDWLLLPETKAAGEKRCGQDHISALEFSVCDELREGYNSFISYARSLLSHLRVGQTKSLKSLTSVSLIEEQGVTSYNDNPSPNPVLLPERAVRKATKDSQLSAYVFKEALVHCSSCKKTYTTSEGYNLHLSLGHCYDFSSDSDCTTLVSSDTDDTSEDVIFLDSVQLERTRSRSQSFEQTDWTDPGVESRMPTHSASLSSRCIIQASLSYCLKSHGSILLDTLNLQDVSLFMINELQKKRELIMSSSGSRHYVHSTSPPMFNLAHSAVQFLFEQLPGNEYCLGHYELAHQRLQEDQPCKASFGCGVARSEGYTARKPFDMFGWLASKHRQLKCITEGYGEGNQQDLPVAMRYRNLKEKTCQSLFVCYSEIHGRGLFTRRPIHEGELIIEYAGELIRSILADVREKRYESKGIGCYFFTINEKLVVDATMKGNAARFINHSCEPNCKSRVVDVLGKKKILIFADRGIPGGEELTYDYKFAFESEDKKLPCRCRARRCRKYMN